MVLWLRCRLGGLHPTCECLGLIPDSIYKPSFLLMLALGGGQQQMAQVLEFQPPTREIHIGDSNGVPSFGFLKKDLL